MLYNISVYRKGDDIVVFDSGHLNFPNIQREFEKIRLDQKRVKTLFLTHADVDHAGGVDASGECIFPEAKIYLGEDEIPYITGQQFRIKKLGFKISGGVQLRPGFCTVKDGETYYIGEIKIEVIHTPGHTFGHDK